MTSLGEEQFVENRGIIETREPVVRSATGVTDTLLNHPIVLAVSVVNASGTYTYVSETDFTINLTSGIITWLGINDPAAGSTYYVTYTYHTLISVTYGGALTIPVKLTVMAKTITDMERVTDLCTIYVRYLFRNKFAQYGFAYTKIDVGGDSQEEAEGESIFSKTITVHNYTEFESSVDGNLLNDINSITLDMQVLSTGE